MSNDEGLASGALQQAGDGIIAVDREGIIRVWNATCEKLFGFAADEAIGQHVHLIIPERLKELHDVAFNAAMDRGALASDGRARRTKGMCRSGDSVFVTMTFAVINAPDGPAIGSVAVAREWIKEG